jgi:hypothetical protein
MAAARSPSQERLAVEEFHDGQRRQRIVVVRLRALIVLAAIRS